jgi:osmotically-inducible protein OsmY
LNCDNEVRGVINNILLEPKLSLVAIRRKIEEELGKAEELEGSRVGVAPKNSEVVSRGTVRSWAQPREPEPYAAAAPGITKVEDQFS